MVLVGVAAKIYEAMGMERWFLSLSRRKYDSFEPLYKLRHDLLDARRFTSPRESAMKEHPSAISSFQRMFNASKGKKIAIFLDYDGTLSPIVSDPERAFMSDQMRAAVRDVSKHFPTAIISGRSREKVYNFVKLNEVYYSGSHGMDIMGPTPKNKSCDDNYHHKTVNEEGNEFIVFQPAKDFRPEIEQMLIEMNERTKNIEGVAIEDNRFCLSVHYRHVKDEDYERLEQQVESMLVNHPKFHMTRGKKVLRERGEGYPILVSSKPRKTMAFHSLRDPSEVLSFLTRLGRWGADNANFIQA